MGKGWGGGGGGAGDEYVLSTMWEEEGGALCISMSHLLHSCSLHPVTEQSVVQPSRLLCSPSGSASGPMSQR